MKINPNTDSCALGGDRGESRAMGSSMADGVGKEIFPSPHKIKKSAWYERSVHSGPFKMYPQHLRVTFLELCYLLGLKDRAAFLGGSSDAELGTLGQHRESSAPRRGEAVALMEQGNTC